MISAKKVPIEKGVEPLIEQIVGLHFRARREAARRNLLLFPLVTIGTPGRHEKRKAGWVISRGTARNLARWPGEFDEVPLEDLLSFRLGVSVVVRNDASAQMAYGIEELLRHPRSANVIKGKRVSYLGLGTGLGGGFATVSKRGRISLKTDGHVGNILMEPFTFHEKRMGYQLKVKVTRKKAVFKFQADSMERNLVFRLSLNRPLEVQDLLSGPGWHSPQTGLSAGGGQVMKALARFEGEVLFRLIQALHEGRVRKAKPWLKWSKADCHFVKNVRTFLVGGGLSANKYFMRNMFDKFQERWADEGCRPVTFLTIINNAWAGALGTGSFVEPDILRRAVACLP